MTREVYRGQMAYPDPQTFWAKLEPFLQLADFLALHAQLQHRDKNTEAADIHLLRGIAAGFSDLSAPPNLC